MTIDQQTARNIKRFKRLRISFWLTCIFWILFLPTLTSSTNKFALLILIGFISTWTYLITLGQLANQANKSVLAWVIGSMLLPLIGVIIGYVTMRGIAIERGWFVDKQREAELAEIKSINRLQ